MVPKSILSEQPMAPEKLAHIVMFPFPAHGHINPMVSLGSLLAHHFGFAISFITTHKNKSILPTNWPHGGQIKSGVIRCITISDIENPEGWSRENGGMPLMWKLVVSTDKMGQMAENVIWNMRQNEKIEITCIISDAFVPWIEEISGNLGVPWCLLWCPSCACNLVNHELPRLLQEGILPITDCTNAGTIIELSAGVLPMSLADIPFSIQFRDPNDPGFASRIKRFSYLKKASWVFVNTTDILEQREISAMKHVYNNLATVGPLLPLEHMDIGVEGTKEVVDCLEWLDTKKSSSVLYVSFGTMATMGEGQFEEFAEGLLGSEQPFLWVVRSDFVPNTSSTYLESFMMRVRGLGFVVPWAPQIKVLGHPSVGGFLSHCGWNSVIESISMGVPLICWPCFAEQNLNAKYVVENWKVGLKLWSGTKSLLVKENVQKIVRTLMVSEEGHALRYRVRNMGSLCKQAWMEGGPSYTNLEIFSRSIISKS